MKTRDEFGKVRYGGFEFGVKNPLGNKNFSAMEQVADKWSRATNLGEQRIDETTRQLAFGYAQDFALSSTSFDNVRIWFNNKGWASSMAYMNAANNMILRASVKAKEDYNEKMDDFWKSAILDETKYGFSVINHPMNYTLTQLNNEVMYVNNNHPLFIIEVTFPLIIIII